jgi:hypothetical protein
MSSQPQASLYRRAHAQARTQAQEGVEGFQTFGRGAASHRAGKDSMTDEQRQLAAIGDAVLLLCARLISHMVKNETLLSIAESEGIEGLTNERRSKADAVEVEIARRFYADGFAGARRFVWMLFDRYVDIEREVQRILNPDPEDKFLKRVRGALKTTLQASGGAITHGSADKAAKLLAAQLNGSSH